MPTRARILSIVVAAGTALLVFIYTPVAWPQSVEASNNEVTTADTPEEIIVYGKRSLVLLEHAVFAAEDRFFEAYNELNLDDEFDVICHKIFQIEAHRRIRICEPKFVIDYEEDFAQGWTTNLATIRRKEELLVGKMLEQITKRPDLMESFTELADAKQDYAAEQQKRSQRGHDDSRE